MRKTANIIGSGPNGLAAAITLAQAGLQVQVFEAEPQPGGAARTMPLTVPGFLHDFGSAVHPMAAGSPFFNSLPLTQHGLEWIHPTSPLAHPLDDGTAVILERNLDATVALLGEDGKSWKRLVGSLAKRWFELAPDLLSPLTGFPRHPFSMIGVGLRAFPPVTMLAKHLFKGERAKALFAGLGAHSFLSLNEPLSSAVGVILGATAHAVGWPIPRGGAQSITHALGDCLAELGGNINASNRVDHIGALPKADLVLCDITPQQLLRIAGERLSDSYRRKLERWRYGPGVFKIDYALSAPIPWQAKECGLAATVHIGGTFSEIAESEYVMRNDREAERPFVLLAQPSLFDPSRAPEGKHTAWAYCHVPNGSTFDMQPRIEAQIERFAPGFQDCILARHVFSPSGLESMDANLVGGDINGGAASLQQFFFRPTVSQYATSAPDIYLCSSSTPPGGGVHGMCGFNAAKRALATLMR